MMAVAIGVQDFGEIRKPDVFYIDKTRFVKEWWESQSKVTLITRPRRFGKTLTMSMVERFFSVKYAGESKIWEGLDIWEDDGFRKLQGSYPVINLTFSGIKKIDYRGTVHRICYVLQELYRKYHFILDSDKFTDDEKEFFRKMENNMPEEDASILLKRLSEYLYRYYDKKVIILLDEYDTPTQEAYARGYWDELMVFLSEFFNYTFKANTYLERGIITGVTRISKESVFSDLNNLDIVTMMSNKYADIFGFTEQEVFSAMDRAGLYDRERVKKWYDGYVIGRIKGIYNPWSITKYLDTGEISTYWANTSSNKLVSELIREGSIGVKEDAENLLRGESIPVTVDEEIVFSQLGKGKNAIWSLLLASGYLKAISVNEREYQLKLVNYEVLEMFKELVRGWFAEEEVAYNGFIRALLSGDITEMEECLNDFAESTFSFFDTGQGEAEKFYHGFVLGLMVELERDYMLTSNRESGKGRYDVVIEPRDKKKDAFIIEFKVVKQGQDSSSVAKSALNQIRDRGYEQVLLDRDFPKEKIREYGFAFEGKKVLIMAVDGEEGSHAPSLGHRCQ